MLTKEKFIIIDTTQKKKKSVYVYIFISQKMTKKKREKPFLFTKKKICLEN